MTNANYRQIWKQFNEFLIKLDNKPDEWEQRTLLFCGYLVNKNCKSTTIKCYISAIKYTLKHLLGYKWDNGKIVIDSLTKACKMVNDRVKTRLPIHWKLLEVMLFELGRIFDKQPFNKTLYRAIMAIGYFGMFRIGELTKGDHVIKAKNVHIGTNKNKILIVLYTSKTHQENSYPQQVTVIVAVWLH